jgi:hypothetical protein
VRKRRQRGGGIWRSCERKVLAASSVSYGDIKAMSNCAHLFAMLAWAASSFILSLKVEMLSFL